MNSCITVWFFSHELGLSTHSMKQKTKTQKTKKQNQNPVPSSKMYHWPFWIQTKFLNSQNVAIYSKFAGQIDIRHMQSVIKDFKTTNMLVIWKFQRVYVTLVWSFDLQNVSALFQSYNYGPNYIKTEGVRYGKWPKMQL